MLNDVIIFNNSSFLSFLFSFINIENITFIITFIIDFLAVTIITVTIIWTILYLIKRNITFLFSLSFISKKQQMPKIKESKESNYNQYNFENKNGNIKSNFISGLLLALEFEAANAILKMSVFTSLAIDKPFSLTISDNFIQNFIIFIMILSIRILINQSFRRFDKVFRFKK